MALEEVLRHVNSRSDIDPIKTWGFLSHMMTRNAAVHAARRGFTGPTFYRREPPKKTMNRC
jgi:hypothetical protein